MPRIHKAQTHTVTCSKCGNSWSFACSPYLISKLNKDHVESMRILDEKKAYDLDTAITSRAAFYAARDRALAENRKVLAMNSVRGRLSEVKKAFGYVGMGMKGGESVWWITESGREYLDEKTD